MFSLRAKAAEVESALHAVDAAAMRDALDLSEHQAGEAYESCKADAAEQLKEMAAMGEAERARLVAVVKATQEAAVWELLLGSSCCRAASCAASGKWLFGNCGRGAAIGKLLLGCRCRAATVKQLLGCCCGTPLGKLLLRSCCSGAAVRELLLGSGCWDLLFGSCCGVAFGKMLLGRCC